MSLLVVIITGTYGNLSWWELQKLYVQEIRGISLTPSLIVGTAELPSR